MPSPTSKVTVVEHCLAAKRHPPSEAMPQSLRRRITPWSVHRTSPEQATESNLSTLRARVWNAQAAAVSQHAVLFEAEVGQGARFGRRADDDVVLQEETGGVGGFTETAGDAPVGVAGGGVAAGVVVDEDEGVGVVNESLAQQVTGGGGAFVQAAAKDFFRASHGEAGVEQNDANGFVAESLHLRADVGVDALRTVEDDLRVRGFLGGAAAEFEGGGEFGGLGGAEGLDLAQDGRLKAGEFAEGFVIPQDTLADLQGVFSLGAGVDEEGEEFGIRQCLGAEAEQALTRAVVFWDVVDAGHDTFVLLLELVLDSSVCHRRVRDEFRVAALLVGSLLVEQ